MTRRGIVLLVIAGLLIVANVGLLYWREETAPVQQVPVPTAHQLAVFQSKADKACLCERQVGGDRNPECWADYERSIKRFKSERIMTACAFEPNEFDYFAPDEKGFSDLVVTLRHPQDRACSAAEEARLVKNSTDKPSCG